MPWQTDLDNVGVRIFILAKLFQCHGRNLQMMTTNLLTRCIHNANFCGSFVFE